MRLVQTLAGSLVLAAAACGAGGAQDEASTAVLVHRDGVASGIILKETDKDVTIRTYVGDKVFSRDQIVEIRTNLSARERAAILARVNPLRDEQEAKARNEALAAGKAKAPETPVVIAQKPAERAAAPAELTEVRKNPYLQAGGTSFGTNAPTAGERMLAGLDKKVTMELVDNDLVEALDLISTMTGINIIVSPKVRELKPKVTLNVKSMDAANVLKWLTKLTDTHIEVQDSALYVSDVPSKAAADEERTEMLLALTRMGADTGILPPEGQEITEADRLKVAMALFEKEQPKPTDFPGPVAGAFTNDPDSNPATNPFQP